MADTGDLATIAFGTTTGFTPVVTELELPEFVREAIEDTPLNHSGVKTRIPDASYDPGS